LGWHEKTTIETAMKTGQSEPKHTSTLSSLNGTWYIVSIIRQKTSQETEIKGLAFQ